MSCFVCPTVILVISVHSNGETERHHCKTDFWEEQRVPDDTSAVLHSANETISEVNNELLPSGWHTLDAGSDALSSLGNDTRQVADSTGQTLSRADAAIGVFGEDTARLQPILESTAQVTANLAIGDLVFASKARTVEKGIPITKRACAVLDRHVFRLGVRCVQCSDRHLPSDRAKSRLNKI
jgi:hypothetical protein